MKSEYLDKVEENRERKHVCGGYTQKSEPCHVKLLQLFLFLLTVSFGFISLTTAAHVSRKACSMTSLWAAGS